jgi:arylsulfatase A-like enzyme
LKAKKPAVLFLGFGETDEFAHHHEYDCYLAKMNAIDKMISDLWYFVQTNTEYKDKTTILITTDHGRGVNEAWHNHGTFTRGSGETWVAVMGAGVEPKGEMKAEFQIYQNQLAATMAALLGLEWHPLRKTGKSISEIAGNEKQIRSAIPIASK